MEKAASRAWIEREHVRGKWSEEKRVSAKLNEHSERFVLEKDS
jgi:hypothetical protein